MIAEELINHMIPPLKPTDSINKGLTWMEELRVNQLPVVDNGEYIGLIGEDIIYKYNNQNALIKDLQLFGQDIFVSYYQHFYDVLKIADTYSVEVIPVLGEESNFLGVVTMNDTLSAFAKSTAMKEPGSIFVLWMDQRDYSLTEISRLVESNNAKILSTYIATDNQDPSKINVTIKVDKTDLARIISTFERFSYRIIAKFQATENQEIDKERLDILFRYLDL
jgi:predicted transcriptional regulator